MPRVNATGGNASMNRPLEGTMESSELAKQVRGWLFCWLSPPLYCWESKTKTKKKKKRKENKKKKQTKTKQTNKTKQKQYKKQTKQKTSWVPHIP